jgi:hypothetical protein
VLLREHRVQNAFGVELERLGLTDDVELRRIRAHLLHERLGNLDIDQLQGVADAHDLHILRLDANDGLDREADRLLVGVHDHRDHAAVEIGTGDDVRVGLGDVHLLVQPHRGDVGQPDAACVAVRFRCEAEHRDLLDQRLRIPVDKAVVAAGDVRIHARAADVLADMLDDQHVDLVEA